MRDDRFPLLDLLRDSLYYPASDFDGTPVKYFAGYVFSFVYVDCGRTQEDLEKELTEAKELTEPGFNGYELIGRRSVTVDELFPMEAMHHVPLPLDLYKELGFMKFCGVYRRLQSDCRAEKDTRELRERLGFRRSDKLYCDWFVFERQAHLGDNHGPFRFSWLFVRAEGALAFERLYVANGMAPKAVAVIQARGLECRDGIFAKCVLGNPDGRPEILLYGGCREYDHYRVSPWPEYRKPCANELKSILRKAGRGLRNSLRDNGNLIVNLIKGDSDKFIGVWFDEINGGHA